MSARPPTFLSLFSGCGALDLGFVRAGFRSLGAIDCDPVALDVHHKNLRGRVYLQDLSQAKIPVGITNHFDVLVAGPPCQGFSTIGQRRLDDPRNSLLLVPAAVAAISKPKVVVVENVPGVAVGQHGRYWKCLHRLLRQTGYRTTELVCDASDFGVPQRRRRLVLVGWRTRAETTISTRPMSRRLLGEALKNVGGLPNHNVEVLKRGSRDFMIASRVLPGQKLTNARGGPNAVHTWDIPEVFGSINKTERVVLNEMIRLRRRLRVRDFGDADPVSTKFLSRRFGANVISSLEKKKYLKRIGKCHDLVGTFNGKYRRLRADSLANTVDTRFGDPRCFLHPKSHRGFTVREAARIQGFPDDFVFLGTQEDQYKMIGNAVPPPMAEGVARLIREAFAL